LGGLLRDLMRILEDGLDKTEIGDGWDQYGWKGQSKLTKYWIR
jgi:hypothetical protein